MLSGYLADGVLNGLAYKCCERSGIYTVGGLVIADQVCQDMIARFAAAPTSRQILKSQGLVVFAGLLAAIPAVGCVHVMFSLQANSTVEQTEAVEEEPRKSYRGTRACT